jgi:hypothetical protein
MKVYLAGGMHSDWRSPIIKAMEKLNVQCYDPCKHGLVNPDAYSYWDRKAIMESDVIVAYMDSDNPSGYGLCFEVGLALGQCKTVIFIDAFADERYNYFDIVRASSTIVVDSIDDAIEVLRKIRFFDYE